VIFGQLKVCKPGTDFVQSGHDWSGLDTFDIRLHVKKGPRVQEIDVKLSFHVHCLLLEMKKQIV